MTDPILSALSNKNPTSNPTGKKPRKRKREDEADKPTVQPAVTLAERKTAEEIRKLEIDNAVKLNHLVSIDMLKGAIGQIDQEIKMQFVDLPRRESETFAARLGIPEKSRELERIWSEYNQKGIENVQATVEKLHKDEVYE